MLLEEWRDVPGYQGRYSVSSLGRIRSYQVIHKPVLLTPSPNKRDGYLLVDLCLNRTRRPMKVARLVLLTFVGPPPLGMTDARHLNGLKTDNRLDNLAWGTRADNEADKKRHGKGSAGERHGLSKLSDAAASELIERYKAGENPRVLALEYGVCISYPASIAGQYVRHEGKKTIRTRCIAWTRRRKSTQCKRKAIPGLQYCQRHHCRYEVVRWSETADEVTANAVPGSRQ